MSIITNANTRSKQVAVVASFAVIYAIMRVIPSFPVIGAPGASFGMSDVLVPIYAIMFGPYISASAIFLGTFIGFVFGKPFIFLGWDFLPATLGALFIGLIVQKKTMIALVMFILGLTIFTLLPYTETFIPINEQLIVPYNWMHIIAVFILISPITKTALQWI